MICLRNLPRGICLLALLLFPSLAAAAAETPFGTRIDEQNIIAGICNGQLHIGGTACACLAERSMTELNDPQREFLILTVVQPPSADKLDIANSKPDMQTIFTFLQTAGQQCLVSTGGSTPAPKDAAAPN